MSYSTLSAEQDGNLGKHSSGSSEITFHIPERTEVRPLQSIPNNIEHHNSKGFCISANEELISYHVTPLMSYNINQSNPAGVISWSNGDENPITLYNYERSPLFRELKFKNHSHTCQGILAQYQIKESVKNQYKASSLTLLFEPTAS